MKESKRQKIKEAERYKKEANMLQKEVLECDAADSQQLTIQRWKCRENARKANDEADAIEKHIKMPRDNLSFL